MRNEGQPHRKLSPRPWPLLRLASSIPMSHVDTDATLEAMTQSLLQVSSVFLVQQNELQGVRERLAKELARVDTIQEALTTAAQMHQDAVLSVVQNYESLAVAHEAALAASGGASGVARTQSVDATAADTGAPATMARWSTGGMSEASERHSAAAALGSPSPPRPPLGSTAKGSVTGVRNASMRTLHLPPVASTLEVFRPAPKPPPADGEEEDEGIQYVENLHVTGGVLGTMLSASAEFVGTPCVGPPQPSMAFHGLPRPSSTCPASALLGLPCVDPPRSADLLPCAGPPSAHLHPSHPCCPACSLSALTREVG